MYYKNGKIEYEGDWIDDKFEGNGKYIYDEFGFCVNVDGIYLIGVNY